jgi:DNA ligase-1
MIKSPMLASDYEESLLVFPKLASPKIDGYRAHVQNGVLSTRSGKPVNNDYIQSMLGRPEFNGLDGELVIGEMNRPDVFEKTSSGVKRKKGEPDFKWIVFDDYSFPNAPFYTRQTDARQRIFCSLASVAFAHLNEKVFHLPHVHLDDLKDMDVYEKNKIEMGFEGIMLRDPNGIYKFGRSTVREGGLLKVKRFVHDEATIIGYEELMHNGNEAFLDELGRTKRSSAAAGLYCSGMIGAYIVKSPKYEKPFKISCGSMDHKTRKEKWEEREKSLGELARFAHFPHGQKDVPRHGIYAGIRDRDDL